MACFKLKNHPMPEMIDYIEDFLLKIKDLLHISEWSGGWQVKKNGEDRGLSWSNPHFFPQK
jgi:hypothetical protein